MVRRDQCFSGSITASSRQSQCSHHVSACSWCGGTSRKMSCKKLVNTGKNEQQSRKWQRCSMMGQCIPQWNCWPCRTLMWDGEHIRVAWQERGNYWRDEEENVCWKYWQKRWELGTWQPGLGARNTLENLSCPLQSAPRVRRNLWYPEIPLRRENTTVMATYCLTRWKTVEENKRGLKVQGIALPINCYRWKIRINSIKAGCFK